MSAGAAFLAAVAQALSSMSLYGAGHPTRERAVAACHERLRTLQREGGAHQRFAFDGGDVVHGATALPDLRHWQWATRLHAAGVHELEFAGEVDVVELEALLRALLARIYGGADGAGDGGRLRVGASADATAASGAARLAAMDTEIAAMREILADAARGRVDGAAVQALARAVAASRARAGGRAVPIVRLPDFDDYLVMHALNTAALAHALAGELRFGRAGAHAACVAGLLHDVGMTHVPADILRRNVLGDAERRLVEEHARIGARLVLEGAPELESAAVVAYEHHLHADGGGYPRLARPRAPHRLAQLVGACSVFSAVTSSRFHWPAWPTELAVRHLEQGAGREFDAACVGALAALARDPAALVAVEPGATAGMAG